MSRQTIDWVDRSATALTRAMASSSSPVCHITYTRDTWVKLSIDLGTYAFEEAKLLCQESPSTWVVWVPDVGEVILDRRHFYC